MLGACKVAISPKRIFDSYLCTNFLLGQFNIIEYVRTVGILFFFHSSSSESTAKKK